MPEVTSEQLERLVRLADEFDRRDRLSDIASDGYFEELWERPHLIGALATMPPKAGEEWTEDQLALWLRTIEGTARLVYKMDPKWGGESDAVEDHAAIFKARYVDALLLALEGEIESGEVQLSEESKGSQHGTPLCNRIERCLDRWAMHAPWLAGEIAAESPTQRVRANVEADWLDEPEEPELDFARPEPEEIEQTKVEPGPGDEPSPTEDEQDFPGAWLAREAYPGPLWQRIPEALKEAGRPLTKDELYEALDQRQGVGAKLSHMVKGGEVTLDDEGRYTLVEEEEPEEDPEPDEEPEAEAQTEEAVEEPEEDFSDTAPIHTKDEPLDIPEHLAADAERLVNLCELEPSSAPELSDATGIAEADVRQLLKLLAKQKRLEKRGTRKRGSFMTPVYRVPPSLEEQGVTVRYADRSGSIESRITHQLDVEVATPVQQLATKLVLPTGEVMQAVEQMERRGEVVWGPGGCRLPNADEVAV